VSNNHHIDDDASLADAPSSWRMAVLSHIFLVPNHLCQTMKQTMLLLLQLT